MRLLLGAAVAALLIASPAMAQTGAAPATCGTYAPAPTEMPDGATASRNEVETFTQSFNAWGESSIQVLTCKRQRAEAALAAANQLMTEYNNEARMQRESIAAWQAEVEEFNARNVPARRDRRSRERN